MSQVRPILDVRELRVEYMSPSGPVVAADVGEQVPLDLLRRAVRQYVGRAPHKHP